MTESYETYRDYVLRFFAQSLGRKLNFAEICKISNFALNSYDDMVDYSGVSICNATNELVLVLTGKISVEDSFGTEDFPKCNCLQLKALCRDFLKQGFWGQNTSVS